MLITCYESNEHLLDAGFDGLLLRYLCPLLSAALIIFIRNRILDCSAEQHVLIKSPLALKSLIKGGPLKVMVTPVIYQRVSNLLIPTSNPLNSVRC